MKKVTLLFAVLTSVCFSGTAGASSWEDSGNWGVYDSRPEQIFNPMNIDFYKDNFEESARYMISGFNRNNVTNDFCIIGYKWKDDSRENKISVIWKDNFIINWEKPENNDSEISYLHSLMNSKPKVDLRNNVVPYEKIGTQTAAWAEEGIKQMIADCVDNGIQIQIKPFKREQQE
ncbi:hypothetical protein ACISK3_03980 [Morganella morganii]|nr:hypothetical protein [Morganella morganii]